MESDYLFPNRDQWRPRVNSELLLAFEQVLCSMEIVFLRSVLQVCILAMGQTVLKGFLPNAQWIELKICPYTLTGTV